MKTLPNSVSEKTMVIVSITTMVVLLAIYSCTNNSGQRSDVTRQIVDSVGFAKYAWQMDSIVSRMDYSAGMENRWRLAIVPHDDYTYVGDLYPAVLNGVKAPTVILIGVAHKARDMGLEDKIVFDSYDSWSAPYGPVRVSGLRETLISKLTDNLYIVNDSMHGIEHSLESLVPFLQYNNRSVEIIPVLVPPMTFERMNQIAGPFAEAMASVMTEKGLEWGKDVAIVVTTDAVHYGDEEWGGRNYAPFGTDSTGLTRARSLEMEIIDSCLKGEVEPARIERFVNYTVQESDHREYKWTWCGRYSVPFGLLMSFELNRRTGLTGLSGTFIGYANSIDHPHLKVDDLGMGTTAPAYNRHWVGYAAIGYK
ncbi:MAG: AmmeMemoRadiSam system protein B [Bacteroidales bacterium]|nr:AmmeMemoRadiSam system protein B [Bacteroidales bacterium]